MKLTLTLALLLLTLSSTLGQSNLPLDTIILPQGFSISVYAEGINGARSLALGDNGTLFVGSRAAGNVYAVTNEVSGYTVHTIASRLNNPNGVAFHNESLYVAEISRIIRYDDIEARLDNPPAPVVIYDQFPRDELHGWKYLRIGPDEKFYVPVGVPCNVCEEDERYGLIYRLNLDGSGLEVVARGVRNTVGFDWDPLTDALWFTDNGRDWVSDDLPPDELNYAPQTGLHFGFPYCHAGFLPDTDFGSRRSCDEFTPPAIQLGPHVAPLGMRFYTGEMFPEEYLNQIFIAEHGSWNRTELIGYRVTLVTVEDNQATRYQVFAEGWLQGGAAWGRPVDVLVMPDGALLVSDDVANAVYRISYSG